MPLNHYVTLGRSGLKVSPLCLGTMTFGQEWGWGADEHESRRVLDRFLELGGNFIDTANFYTHGHSEKIIGDYFAQDRGKRHQAVIATKFFGSMRMGDPNAGGAGRKNVIWACEESLRRLQTDFIDLYWMHCWDYHTPIDETLRALDDLVSAGKVRYVGFSDTPAWKVAQAQTIALFQGWAPLVGLQIEYSLLQRTVEGELIPAARELGLGVTPWSPLKYGLLSGKYRRENRGQIEPNRGDRIKKLLENDSFYDLLDVILAVAQEADTTPARVSLQWLCTRPGVASPIIGARTVEQLEDNVAAVDARLTPEQLERLSAASKPSLNFPADFLEFSPSFRNPETTLNGESAAANPLAAKPGEGF